MAQRKDFLDTRGIIELACLRTLIRRARLIGGVHALARRAIVGVGENRLYARLFQGDKKTVASGFRRRLPQLFALGFRYAA